MKTPEGFEKADIDKYLKGIEAYIVKPTSGGYGASGVPDRVCCIDGHFWGIEVKREGKGPTPIQEARMLEITLAGGYAIAGTAAHVCVELENWRLTRGLPKAKWMPRE